MITPQQQQHNQTYMQRSIYTASNRSWLLLSMTIVLMLACLLPTEVIHAQSQPPPRGTHQYSTTGGTLSNFPMARVIQPVSHVEVITRGIDDEHLPLSSANLLKISPHEAPLLRVLQYESQPNDIPFGSTIHLQLTSEDITINHELTIDRSMFSPTSRVYLDNDPTPYIPSYTSYRTEYIDDNGDNVSVMISLVQAPNDDEHYTIRGMVMTRNEIYEIMSADQYMMDIESHLEEQYQLRARRGGLLAREEEAMVEALGNHLQAVEDIRVISPDNLIIYRLSDYQSVDEHGNPMLECDVDHHHDQYLGDNNDHNDGNTHENEGVNNNNDHLGGDHDYPSYRENLRRRRNRDHSQDDHDTRHNINDSNGDDTTNNESNDNNQTSNNNNNNDNTNNDNTNTNNNRSSETRSPRASPPQSTASLDTSPLSRQAHALKRWTCPTFPNNITPKIRMSILVDFGAARYFSGNTATPDANRVMGQLNTLGSLTNGVYRSQLGFVISFENIHIATRKLSESWAYDQRTSSGSGCPGDANGILSGARTWHASQQGDKQVGLTHQLTNCLSIPGVVGVAYLSAVCSKNTGAGITHVYNGYWTTFAHEVGHNLGAPHPFQNGGRQGSFGGLMDYNTQGRLNSNDPDSPGEVGFNRSTDQNAICNHVTQAYKTTGSYFVPLDRCWDTGNSTPTPTPDPDPTPTPTPTTYSWKCGLTTQTTPTGVCTSSNYFGACSVKCGPGTQTRNVRCVGSDGKIAADRQCLGVQKPSTTQVCTGDGGCPTPDNDTYGYVCGAPSVTQSTATTRNTGECTPFGYYGQCETDCKKTRAVFCKNLTKNTIHQDASPCKGQSLPIHSLPCTGDRCKPSSTYTWVCGSNTVSVPNKSNTGQCTANAYFSQCSTNCGVGTRTRKTFCRRDTDGAFVSIINCTETRPASKTACILYTCRGEQGEESVDDHGAFAISSLTIHNAMENGIAPGEEIQVTWEYLSEYDHTDDNSDGQVRNCLLTLNTYDVDNNLMSTRLLGGDAAALEASLLELPIGLDSSREMYGQLVATVSGQALPANQGGDDDHSGNRGVGVASTVSDMFKIRYNNDDEQQPPEPEPTPEPQPCALQCGANGTPNAECTACVCNQGFYGAQCNCQGSPMTFYTQYIPYNFNTAQGKEYYRKMFQQSIANSMRLHPTMVTVVDIVQERVQNVFGGYGQRLRINVVVITQCLNVVQAPRRLDRRGGNAGLESGIGRRVLTLNKDTVDNSLDLELLSLQDDIVHQSQSVEDKHDNDHDDDEDDDNQDEQSDSDSDHNDSEDDNSGDHDEETPDDHDDQDNEDDNADNQDNKDENPDDQDYQDQDNADDTHHENEKNNNSNHTNSDNTNTTSDPDAQCDPSESPSATHEEILTDLENKLKEDLEATDDGTSRLNNDEVRRTTGGITSYMLH